MSLVGGTSSGHGQNLPGYKNTFFSLQFLLLFLLVSFFVFCLFVVFFFLGGGGGGGGGGWFKIFQYVEV